MTRTDYNPDVLTCLANLSNDEVFTPPHIANQMLDLLPAELWSNPKAKFLDPFTKSGVFLREIAKRLIAGLEAQMPDLQQRINHIMANQIYGIAITELTSLLARRSLYCTKDADNEYSVANIFDDHIGNIAYENIPHTWNNDGRCKYCGVSREVMGEDLREGMDNHAYQFIHDKNPFENMQFDVIIGNPPYQLNVGIEQKSFAIAIYHKFIQQAIKLRPRYICMIVPSRWFAGGRGLDEFREDMLNEKGLTEIHDFPNASDVFPGVEIKGGVNYFLWKDENVNDCKISMYVDGELISTMMRPLRETQSDIFIRDNNAVDIYRKVKSLKEKSFNEFVSVQTPFGLLSSFKNYSKMEGSKAIKLYGNQYVGYIEESQVLKNQQWLNEYKIFIPKAFGSGNTIDDRIKPILGEKKSCCTQTYIMVGPFRNKERCENIISYINTKFFHFMVGIKKITQDAMRGVYQFVPQQDFSKPWTDEELYKKYNLTQDEIDYIEKMVRPME